MRPPGWNVSAGPELCSGNNARGYPPHDVAPRRPFYVTAGAVYRCEDCTEAPRDDYAITHAEQELDRLERRARQAAARVAAEAESGPGVDVARLVGDVERLIGKPHSRPVIFLRPRRPLIPYPQLDTVHLGFDHKAAEAGDDR
jgi:hypothetical protein